MIISKYYDQIEKLQDTGELVYNKNNVIEYSLEEDEKILYNMIESHDKEYFFFPKMIGLKEWETALGIQQKNLINI